MGSTSLQPTLGLGFRGLSLSAWGSVGLTDPADTKELDLTLGYTIGGLNVGFGTATAGAVPFATDFYGTNGLAVTHLSLQATKSIKVTDSFSIPVFGQVMVNPC